MKLVLFWVCLVQAALLMATRHDDLRTTAQDLTSLRSELWNQRKPRTLFARRGAVEYQKLRATKPHVEAVPVTPRCSRVSESCFPHSNCCDPCASCHCRFFNTICYCWRLGRHCQKKT
ncbi:hypothetical protein NFI96_013519 [Prochilodus magdalenae]|nr:hypothetical protein NFI96_013519 [Prochilodus magdalenae]